MFKFAKNNLAMENKNIKTVEEFKKDIAFDLAKDKSITIAKNSFRRIFHEYKLKNIPTKFCAYKDNDGVSWVIGDTLNEIPFPDKYIMGLPAYKVIK